MNDRKFYATTFDNPFNPFEDFDSWFLFDCEKGYYTCNKIARLSNVKEEMSEKEEQLEVERAIERLIEIDPLNIYVKIYRPGSKPDKKVDEPSL